MMKSELFLSKIIGAKGIQSSPLLFPANNVLNPKKRWIEQAAAASTSTSTSSAAAEVLARPIRWGEDEENQLRMRSQQERSRRSPKSLIVATALVELASDSSPSKSESGSTSGATADQNQPLNLSVNSR